jgi:pyridoxamine 5'-phosphate oxidase
MSSISWSFAIIPPIRQFGQKRRLLMDLHQQQYSEPTRVDDDPFSMFENWFSDARSHSPIPEAMVLSTAGHDSAPSSRVVLLKQFDSRGFVFYTNYGSRKATEISLNPLVSLNFYWPGPGRQIRIEGVAEKTEPEISDAYFMMRDRESQIGAWASRQSGLLASREELDSAADQFSERFAGQAVPRPPHWGGYRVVPRRIEFWQNRPARLHERTVFIRTPENTWQTIFLFP